MPILASIPFPRAVGQMSLGSSSAEDKSGDFPLKFMTHISSSEASAPTHSNAFTFYNWGVRMKLWPNQFHVQVQLQEGSILCAHHGAFVIVENSLFWMPGSSTVLHGKWLYIVTGPSEISSKRRSIITRRTEYLNKNCRVSQVGLQQIRGGGGDGWQHHTILILTLVAGREWKQVLKNQAITMPFHVSLNGC